MDRSPNPILCRRPLDVTVTIPLNTRFRRLIHSLCFFVVENVIPGSPPWWGWPGRGSHTRAGAGSPLRYRSSLGTVWPAQCTQRSAPRIAAVERCGPPSDSWQGRGPPSDSWQGTGPHSGSWQRRESPFGSRQRRESPSDSWQGHATLFGSGQAREPPSDSWQGFGPPSDSW